MINHSHMLQISLIDPWCFYWAVKGFQHSVSVKVLNDWSEQNERSAKNHDLPHYVGFHNARRLRAELRTITDHVSIKKFFEIIQYVKDDHDLRQGMPL